MKNKLKNEHVVFKKFQEFYHAKELKELLEKNNISAILSDDAPPVDVTFTGNANYEFEVRIQQEDFVKAEKILMNEADSLMDSINEDYYLFDFSNDELFDVLLKQDEWNELDYLLAQKILKNRGEDVNQEMLDNMKQKRLEDLSKPEGGQTPWIFLGYILALLGGVFGLLMGYFLWTHKKVLPNGEKVYSYAEADRKQGKYILILGAIVAIISLAYKLFTS